MKKPVLILGASSSIARAIAFQLAEKGYPIYLAGREKEDLQRIASDLQIRCKVNTYFDYFDAENMNDHQNFLQQTLTATGGLDGVVLAFGYLGHQHLAQKDFQEAKKIIDTNFTQACSILTYCANYFENQKSGFIMCVTSVAGDRGRSSNYFYGAAKGGLSLFLQGLRNRLFSSGVQVINIKPGFIDTAMTFGKPGMFLVASPDAVGKKAVNAIGKSCDQVYAPGFWRYIMWIVKSIPETIFKRLGL